MKIRNQLSEVFNTDFKIDFHRFFESLLNTPNFVPIFQIIQSSKALAPIQKKPSN